MDHEEWRRIEEFKGMYEVSNLGRVRSYVRSKIPRLLKPYTDPRGYQQIVFTIARKSTTRWLHRLVAHAFIPNPDSRPEVNHKDANKQNNAASNLEWVTSRENTIHGYRFGVIKPPCLRGEQGNHSRLTEADVLEIRRIYTPRVISQSMLAARFGVTKTTIRHILQRRTWTHV